MVRKWIGRLMVAAPFVALISGAAWSEFGRFGWSGLGHVALVFGVIVGIVAWFGVAAMLLEARRP